MPSAKRCHRGRFGSRPGAGSWDPAVHRFWAQHSQHRVTPAMKSAVEEPNQSVKSLLALPWSVTCSSITLHKYCQAGVVTLSENFMLWVGKPFKVFPTVLCTNA